MQWLAVGIDEVEHQVLAATREPEHHAPDRSRDRGVEGLQGADRSHIHPVHLQAGGALGQGLSERGDLGKLGHAIRVACPRLAMPTDRGSYPRALLRPTARGCPSPSV